MRNHYKLGTFAVFFVIGVLSLVLLRMRDLPHKQEKVSYKSNKEVSGPIDHPADGVVYKNTFYKTADLTLYKDNSFEQKACYDQFSEISINDQGVLTLYRSDKLVYVGQVLGTTKDGAGLIVQDATNPTRALIFFKIYLDSHKSIDDPANQAILVVELGNPNSYILSPSMECPKLK